MWLFLELIILLFFVLFNLLIDSFGLTVSRSSKLIKIFILNMAIGMALIGFVLWRILSPFYLS